MQHTFPMVFQYLSFWEVLRAQLLLCRRITDDITDDITHLTWEHAADRERIEKILKDLKLTLTKSMTKKYIGGIWTKFLAIPNNIRNVLRLSQGTWNDADCTKKHVMKTLGCFESIAGYDNDLSFEIICKKFLQRTRRIDGNWYNTLRKHFEQICYGCGCNCTAQQMTMHDGIYRLCAECQEKYCTDTVQLQILTNWGAQKVRETFSEARCGITCFGGHMFDRKWTKRIIARITNRDNSENPVPKRRRTTVT